MTSTKKTKTAHVQETVPTPEPSAGTDAQTSSATSAATTGTPTGTAGGGTLGATIMTIKAMLAELPIVLGRPGSPAKPLNIEQRRVLPKMRTGAEEQVPAVLALADKYKISLAGSGTAEARADMQLVTELQPLETELAAAIALVSDTVAQAKSRIWETTTACYGTMKLRRYQREYPALQRELDPMASFMAVKYKSAPTALRQAEGKTLSKSRATAKSKLEKAAKGATGTVVVPATPAATHPPASPPPSDPPAAATETVAPAASGAGGGAPATSTNGAPHA